MDGADVVNVGDCAGPEVGSLPEQLAESLDRLCDAFRDGESPYRLMAELAECAASAISMGGGGAARARQQAAVHPIGRFIYQCPLTRHSFEKPRGYAGDAGLIDYIYGHQDTGDALERTSPIGRAILAHNTDGPAAAAVRARRNIVAGMIGDAVRRTEQPRILSVACGNARELELVDPALLARVGALVGFDQDERSLSVAERYRLGRGRVVPVQGTIVELLKDGSLDGFDLIYAAGLFDYLSDRLCRRLTKNLLARLNKGGRLLVANFLPGVRDTGYMEAFMHWTLVYRGRHGILDFTADIAPEDLGRCRYFMEPNRSIGFLEITRA